MSLESGKCFERGGCGVEDRFPKWIGDFEKGDVGAWSMVN